MSAAGLRKRLTALNRLPSEGTRAAAKKVETLAREVGQAVGPVALGKHGRRVQLTAVSRFKGSGNHVEATVWGRPTGPWVWVTAGTVEPSNPQTRGRREGAHHPLPERPGLHPSDRPPGDAPGRVGRGAWRRVTKRAESAVPDVYADAIRKLIGS